MNLIYDAWVPVRRASGKKEKIAPFEITDKKDPVMELAALRPDFNGALIQFLIGLLQTTCAPDSKAQWRDWLKNPPSEEELKSKFEPVRFAFYLNGEGPRFMQNDNCNLDLWAFGYEMKNMNILCWREDVMPIITIEEDKRQIYEAEVATLIHTAEEIAFSLKWAVRSAFFSRPKEKGDVRVIVQRFWQETESDFYRLISKLREEILAERDGVSVKEEWHKCLTRTAERIFDDVSQSEMIDEVNVKRVAEAWNTMKRNINSKKIKQELGLPG